MKNNKLLYIFLYFPFFLFSQTKQEKITQIENLLDSSYVKTVEFNLQASIGYAKKALDLSKKKNYSRGIAISNFRIGQCLAELNTYKQGLEYLDKAEEENTKLQDQALNFEIRRVRSRIYGNFKLYGNAITENRKALMIIPLIKKREEEKDFARILAYENIATAYTFMNKLDSAYYYLNKSRIMLEKSDLKKFLPNLINNYTELGDYYTIAKQPDKATHFLRKAVSLAQKNQYPYLSFTFKKYGDLMLYQKNNDSALIYYKKAQDISEETRLRSELPAIYQKISHTYFLLGNKTFEEKYKLRALELQDSLNTEVISASNLVINTILSDQKEELVQKNKKRQSYLLLISAVILLLLLGLWLLFIRKTKNLNHIKKISSEKEQMLIQQKEEITLRYEEDTKNLEQRVNESFDEVVQLAKNNSPEFFTRFREVYPEVIAALLAIDPKLRVSELSLCAYFFLGFRTKDISIYTFKSLSTIRNRRQNLRKKLEILPDEDLELWFKKLVNKNN
ncbi:MAG TPA: hypothetical protein DF603_17470 [Chryseobacterium sp.]|nr:hypothetical protein [Chryseobacterium sp.]